MERRRKNNIIIGTLCAVLVLMGVGYAILSTTLNIGATANITGDFDIHFTNIQRSSSTISDSSILSTIDAGTGITANTNSQAGTFTAVLQKPTDYVIYTVSVANTGSIDGYLTFSFNDTNSNFNYYKDYYSVEFIRDDVNPAISTDILQPNASFSDPDVLINTSGTRTYKIKVTFKESATSFPDPTHEINNEQVGNFECSLNLTYSQQAPGGNTPTPVSSDGWAVDNNGLVTQSPSNAVQNGTLTIPAVDQNGNNIVSINTASILPEHNAIYYYTDEDKGYVVITDQTNYESLEAQMQKMEFIIISNVNQIPAGENIEQNIYLNIDPTIDAEDFDWDDIQFASLSATVLDLSNATYLTSIGDDTFMAGSFEEIIFNNAITSIGRQAFAACQISSLTIPSSLTTIGDAAFASNGLSTLDLSNATSLTTIGDNAFANNSLSELDLSGASNLTTIGEEAFYRNIIATLNLTGLSHLTSIGTAAFEKQQNSMQSGYLTQINISDTTKASFQQKTLGEEWYDPNGHPTFVFSDYTCTNNLNTCVAN